MFRSAGLTLRAGAAVTFGEAERGLKPRDYILDYAFVEVEDKTRCFWPSNLENLTDADGPLGNPAQQARLVEALVHIHTAFGSIEDGCVFDFAEVFWNRPE